MFRSLPNNALNYSASDVEKIYGPDLIESFKMFLSFRFLRLFKELQTSLFSLFEAESFLIKSTIFSV
jgi:hypothetical protein